MNPFFDWLKDSGTQGILVLVGTVAAIIGAIAAVFAASYGKAAPTRDDLKRVEDHTAATSAKLDFVEGHLSTMNQSAAAEAEHDAAMDRAQSVSIKVWGEDHIAQLLHVHLTPRDLGVVLTRIGLYNEHGSCFGGIDCARESDTQFGAPLTPDQFGRWMQGGSFENTNRVRARLRVFMSFNGRDGYRDMSVSLFSGFVTRGNTSGPVNQIDGKV